MAAVPAVTADTARRLGRFELRRELGKGAQATVWLALDTRLEREVAIKVLAAGVNVAGDDLTHWLQEARSVSRLAHPNIVPVFEADVHDGRACLVFEYVPGRTLAEHARARGALPPHEAAGLMLGVLDALQAAHEAGVVHRDLKPSNVLVDGHGRARVMDFGIAARLKEGANRAAAALIVGTPGYMSPEATRGAPATPAMDVFAAGVMLVELISGRPLVAERDPYRAMKRVAEEDLALPPDLPAAADDTLRGVLRRAIARDPAQRWGSAAALGDALRQWMAPQPAAPGGNSGTLDFLLRRMRHKSDFPALSDSVARIQRIASSEHESLTSLSSEILKDVALTNKLLRLVNTAHFSHAGGGSISTVSRAVALVGFAGIRNMALSLVLLEHMSDKQQAGQLKEEFLRALMSGSLAGELCRVPREGEEAFIGAMFQNLGRLLTEYYFPEEARQIRGIALASRHDAPSSAAALLQAETAASVSVLGLSFEDLGLGIARSWGLPETLQRCMRKPDGEPPARVPDKPADRLRCLAVAANELTDTLLRTEGDPTAALAATAERHARALGLSAREIAGATDQARQRLAQMARAMNLQVAPGSPSRRLLATVVVEPPPQPDDSLSPHQLQATVTAYAPTLVEAPAAAAAPAVNAAEVLAAGIADITNSMVESFKLNEVLRMILETMFRALGFRRIVFCLRDPKTDTLTGRFGLGEGAERVAQQFKVPLKGGTDLFAAVCAKGADTLISDASAGQIAARLPGWYRSGVDAPAFLLLPLLLKGAPFALIYADKAEPGGIALGEKELALLRTLRNQAVMAFRQAG